jgi:hypothetical protein
MKRENQIRLMTSMIHGIKVATTSPITINTTKK